MGFFDKFQRQQPSKPESTTPRQPPPDLDLRTLPIREPILDGRAICHVQGSAIWTPAGAVDCLWYRTEGAPSAVGQEELHLLLKRSNEHGAGSVPTEPIVFFDNALRMAAAGRMEICPGAWHEFNRPLMGVFSGVVYTPASLHPPLSKHPEGLVVHGLTSEEFGAMRDSGPLRLVSLLGRQQRYFPWPPWIDCSRPTLGMAGIRESSIMSKVQRVGVWGATATLLGQTLAISIPQYAREALAANLAKHEYLALTTGLASSADSCLSWDGNQDDLVVATGNSSNRVAGCFTWFLCLPEKGNTFGIQEDGFTVTLVRDSWNRLCEAIAAVAPLDLDMGTSGQLQLRWTAGS